MSPQHFLSDEGLYVFALMGSVLGLISYQRLDGRKDIQSVNSAWSKGCTMNTHTHTHTHKDKHLNGLFLCIWCNYQEVNRGTMDRMNGGTRKELWKWIIGASWQVLKPHKYTTLIPTKDPVGFELENFQF